ncbi:endonuclease/exonuclease/phosphatase family protein [Klenkia terrae]|uniref:Endonuclease/exonuclease/phosphatase family protein n=1 Tax=Klenkia terrae TaxID=1052259 RepID=A0ABU8E534_9ACTN|nr:endonuclease/exonuclease/phosphatase family protein [Klenkia terrae]SSC24936.1 Endonuclease/exonuclease/phosphatase [Klenkia terrae]
MAALRLVTFNIRHGVGDDGRHDLVRVAELLQRTDADVVCLQEVDRNFGPRSEDVDQAEVLSRALDRELVWASAIEKGVAGAPARRYGNALLSRLPVLDEQVLALPGEGEPRSAVRALLGLGSSALTVVTTHLSSQSARARAAQAEALVGLLPAEGPAVVVGDLNCGPTAPELAPLRQRLRDGWQAAGSRADQASGWQLWKREQGLTHPARSPRVRIDQVWVSPGVGVRGAEVLDGSTCSDHHPLQLDLEIG